MQLFGTSLMACYKTPNIFRKGSEIMFDGKMKRTIRHSEALPASPRTVFEVLRKQIEDSKAQAFV
jgi:hypothetical protein